MAQYEIAVELDFAAAHQIPGHPGKCARMHGHNYRVVVQVAGEKLNELGMLADFADVRQLCQEVIGELDHHTLNDLPAFAGMSPTSEHIARFIYQAIAGKMKEGLRVSAVTVYESPKSAVTYRE